MKITKMDIREIIVSQQDLQEIFTQWAKEAAMRIARERADEERMEQFMGATYAAIMDRSLSTLMERCEEDPQRVGEWFAGWFLDIIADLQRETDG